MILLMVFSTAIAEKRILSLDDIYSPEKKIKFSGESPPNLTWSDSGDHLIKSGKYQDEIESLFARIDPSTGAETSLADKKYLLEALISLAGFDKPDAEKALKKAEFVLSPAEDKILVNCSGDLFLFEISNRVLKRLTTGGEEEKEAVFSPDGNQVTWIRDGDIFLLDLITGDEQKLTSRPGKDVQNGYLDWVYQEEVYGRGDFKAYWWSPDSRSIAFLRLDVSDVPVNTIVDQRSIHPKVETQLYPHPGDPNARVRLGIITVADGNVRWMDLERFGHEDFLVVMVNWTPDSRLTAQVQNRTQTWLELLSFDPRTGSEKLLIKETSPAWVDRIAKPCWLTDGSFLWQSDRTGFRHIYHYSSEGELIKQITSGDRDVRKLNAVSEEKNTLFFTASGESVTERHVFKVNLDGTGMEKITEKPGNHQADFNKQGTLFIDKWSDINTPPRIFLKNADGRTTRTVFENRVEVLEEYQPAKPEFVQVKARDGFVMEAMIIKPPDFDETKKYPVLMHTYGGPGSQSVLNRWGGTTYMWHRYLAEQGYIIWMFDGRISSGKGSQSAWEGYKNLGPVAVEDYEDGLDWLTSHPWVDGERVGIWGWSYGGYVTAFSLTHSSYFKVGIAGAPVTDWSFYDSIYTERYMGRPGENPEEYKATSVVEAAEKLQGKLLIIHGAIDDNVQVLNSMIFMDKLQKAGIQFEFMVYPGSRHGVRDEHQVRQMREMMTRFILENL